MPPTRSLDLQRSAPLRPSRFDGIAARETNLTPGLPRLSPDVNCG
ncbi:cytochrome P450 domain protein [Mycobacteroides abscessus subsp. bolletii 2B-1231]|nr:cytochrome P450 domain protein [Mycobacteroides abscessus subsp. bolletii 2B-0626]EIV12964.1 cytochrome P450 domain protein [Mycobacteroides abscessus subsp. bolletii 2B-0912-R]EIV22877.1 cytochrome P450 domain protein [Mycobacteroides abscessus subsp. bolletii 2B-0912-S]EIV76841.1 cytochrome P450 domain protein [Mycobacteroides abscessus subsp. bolletii 2B-1231]EIV79979.1 cytochrome P450 domain protein [Mycobacteroides abscessus subsp. bolletii 2B-0107]ETZ76721.1 cytochrome P450 domain pro